MVARPVDVDGVARRRTSSGDRGASLLRCGFGAFPAHAGAQLEAVVYLRRRHDIGRVGFLEVAAVGDVGVVPVGRRQHLLPVLGIVEVHGPSLYMLGTYRAFEPVREVS